MDEYDLDAAIERIRAAEAEKNQPQEPEQQPAKQDDSVGGMFSRFLDSAGDIGGRVFEGAMDPIYGASQFLENSVESVAPGVVDAVGNADAWLHDKTGGFLGKEAGVDVDEQLRQREQAYEDTYDVDGIDWARGAGNVLTGVALAPSVAGMSLPAAAGTLALEGAAGGAFMPQVGEDDYWSQVGSDALVGGLAGGVGGTALNKLGGVVTKQLNRPGVGVLKEAGVQPTVGQSLGGVVNDLEQKATSIPLVGEAINSARKRAQAEMRDATLQRVGGKLGVDITESGSAGIAQAQNAVSNAYDEAAAFLPTMNVSDDLFDGVSKVLDDVETSDAAEGTVRGLNKFYNDNILPRLKGGEVSAEGLQALDADFSAAIGRSGTHEYKAALGEMREMITDAAAGQSDEYGKAATKAKDAFRDLAVIERAGKVEEFTPAQLNQAIRANDTSVRKRAYAAGKGPLRDISDAANEVLGSTVGDSGTAGRAVLNGLTGLGVGGAGVATGSWAPLLAAGLAGAAGSTRTGQKGIIGLLDILGKGGEKVGQEGLSAGSLLSYLNEE